MDIISNETDSKNLGFLFLETLGKNRGELLQNQYNKGRSGGAWIYSHFGANHSPQNGDCAEDGDCLKDSDI